MTVRPDAPRRVFWPERPAYTNGMLLDEQDFVAEQGYHRDRLMRALAYLHGAGTVAGLDVTIENGESPLVKVSPGLAVDRIGRLIETSQPLCLRLAEWYDDRAGDPVGAAELGASFTAGSGTTPDHVIADVFLGFRECETAKRPAFASGNFDALDAIAPLRLRDGYEASLVIRPEDTPPLPAPAGPSPAGGDFAARLADLDRIKREEGWREDLVWDANDLDLNPGPEHRPGQNPADLFLARLMIPVTAGSPPERNPSLPAGADNTQRRMAYSAPDLLALIRAGS